MYYINGEFVEAEKASLPVLDLGLLRGCSIFDYLRTYNGLCFHLKEHLERLAYSARQIGLELPHTLAEIEEIVIETKRRNPFKEASIKILITGGVSSDQFTPAEKTHLIVLVYPLKAYPSTDFTEGINAVTTSLHRSFPQSKTTQYLPAIVAMKKGEKIGAKEALYLNGKQEILEATTSNFFGFKNGTLYTCDSEEILFGITREIILHLAKPHFPVELKPLNYSELHQIEEAFITASNKEVMPVVQIDEIRIGSGRVGPKTKKLMELFMQYTQEMSWPPLTIDRYVDRETFLRKF